MSHGREEDLDEQRAGGGPEVKWEVETLTAQVGRLHLTVSAPDRASDIARGTGLAGWFWQVWVNTTRMDGEKASGRAPTLEAAQAEAIKHTDPKAQRAWRKARGL